ncbi:MAG: hypothetical protein P9L97_13225 [Candidatus Tenebribacter davisii]|nr:hypothetical protein [Candidatus Tenebribacter davisii]
MQHNSIESETGFVILLDALGMKNKMLFEENEAEKIIEIWDTLIHDSVELSKKYVKQVKWREIIDSGLCNIEIRGFSDTLIILIKVGQKPGLMVLDMVPLGELLGSIFVLALKKGILLRGAVSYGEYSKSQYIVAGRAMNEVIAWYEQLDMIGIMATPNFANIIKQKNKDILRKQWSSYPYTHMKNGVGEILISNWIYTIQTQFSSEIEDMEKFIFSIFQQNMITPEIYSKYENTYNFFQWVKNIEQ